MSYLFCSCPSFILIPVNYLSQTNDFQTRASVSDNSHVQQESFEYLEEWLTDLVPQHANTSACPLILNLSLNDEDFSNDIITETRTTVNDEINDSTLAETTKQQHAQEAKQLDESHMHNQPLSNNLNPPLSTQISTPWVSKMSLEEISEKELLHYICSSIRFRKGKFKNESVRVVFSEHPFSQLCNGKIKKEEGSTIRNRIIKKNKLLKIS